MSSPMHSIQSIQHDCEILIIQNLYVLLDRYERDPDYTFVDMKFKAFDGTEFPESPDGQRTIYSKDVLYGIIQGRALEALAGHINWLPNATTLSSDEKEVLFSRTRSVLEETTDSLEALRATGNGHVYFMMPKDRCIPLQINDDGSVVPWEDLDMSSSNVTDIFYAKGLLAAAHCLGRDDLLKTADALFRQTVTDILNNTIVIDRQAMDPKNPVEHVPGRCSYAYRMLALGGVAMAIDAGLGEFYIKSAQQMINDNINVCMNTGQYDHLQENDYLEYLNEDDLQPWQDDQGRIWCDPGHALEFIGLAMKAIIVMASKSSADSEILDQLRQVTSAHFIPVFTHIYKLGYTPDVGGICKSYNLADRCVNNADMPWWNLPETIRAAAELIAFFPDADHSALHAVIAQCHENYMSHYAIAERQYIPIQTRDVTGAPVDIIPAMPDADPLYHTGLSLIDTLNLLR
jgi:hypothetical protein